MNGTDATIVHTITRRGPMRSAIGPPRNPPTPLANRYSDTAVLACAIEKPWRVSSVGVNVMFDLVRRAAALLGDGYDIEMVELHHKLKKDAPSGTAMRLAEVAAEARGLDPAKELNYGRHGMVGERPAREIGVQTDRGGDIVGEHTVFYCGQGERLEITHRATSRDQFARGAVRAAQWLPGRAAGLYDMADVLGLKGK